MRFDTDLARATGISPNTIGNIWKSHRKDFPTSDRAVLISRALGTTVEYLVTGDAPPVPQLAPEIADVCKLLSGLSGEQITELRGVVRSYIQSNFASARDPEARRA